VQRVKPAVGMYLSGNIRLHPTPTWSRQALQLRAFSNTRSISPNCTLIAPASKHPDEWLARDYTEIHNGDTVKLATEYNGKILTNAALSQLLSGVTISIRIVAATPH
jgi:hypothetical protein